MRADDQLRADTRLSYSMLPRAYKRERRERGNTACTGYPQKRPEKNARR